MRDEVVRSELQHEKSDLKKQHDSHLADKEEEAAERVVVLADLRSLLERRYWRDLGTLLKRIEPAFSYIPPRCK